MAELCLCIHCYMPISEKGEHVLLRYLCKEKGEENFKKKDGEKIREWRQEWISKEVLTILLPSGMIGDHTEEFKWGCSKNNWLDCFVRAFFSIAFINNYSIWNCYCSFVSVDFSLYGIEAVQSPFQIYSQGLTSCLPKL